MKQSEEWLEGYDDCKAGVSRWRNPYLADLTVDESNEAIAKKFHDWREGWTVAFSGEKM